MTVASRRYATTRLICEYKGALMPKSTREVAAGDPAPDDKKWIAKLKRRITLARRFPTNTDPFVRHVQIMAECLAEPRGYPMLLEEPLHCAVSLLATVDNLYRARNELAALKKKRKPRKRGL